MPVAETPVTTVDVAVLGPDSPQGQAVLAALAESRLARRVHALSTGGAPGRLVEFGDDQIAVNPPEDFDYSGVALVFLCNPADLSAQERERLGVAGVPVIDCCGGLGPSPARPRVVAEINPERLAEAVGGGVACPTALAAVLALVLAPLQRRFGLEAVQVSTYEAVGGLGRSGVRALDQEVRELLNFRTPEQAYFGRTLAFNVLPIVEAGPDEVVDDLRSVLDEPGLPVALARVRVPVFHGDGVAVFARLGSAVNTVDVEAALAGGPGLEMVSGEGEPPSPLTEAAVGEGVYVSLLSGGAGGDRTVRLWVAVDAVRRGLGLNAVRVAELLLKEYL